MSTTTSAAVTATLDRIAAAWNAGDATAYAAEFTADATYVTFQGDVLRGRTAIDDVHRFLFDGPLRGSRMDALGGSPEVRFLHDDVAHVLVDGGVRLDGQEDVPAERASIVSFVLERIGGAWRIAAFQNTRRAGGRP